MCIYIQTMPLCGHPPPTLLSYASCTNFLSQLMRIAEPEAWEPENVDKVPFELQDDCDPNPNNIYVLYSDDYCGWECRNNHYQLALAHVPRAGGFGSGGAFGLVDGGLLPACIPADERGQFVGHNQPMVLGMPHASYGPGSERLGIGWRN